MVCRERRGILKKLFIWLGFLCVLFFTVAASGTEAEPAVRRIGTAVKNKVNLREEASKNSALLVSLKKGEEVEILGEETGKDNRLWYRCRFGDKTGYIREDMLAVAEITLPEEAIRNPDEQEDPSGEPAPSASESAGDWKAAYYQYLVGKEFVSQVRSRSDPAEQVCYTDRFGVDYYFGPDNEHDGADCTIRFALYDWDLNGVPELFAYCGLKSKCGDAYYAYTFRNGHMEYLGIVGTGCWYDLIPYRDENYNIVFSELVDSVYYDVYFASWDGEGSASMTTLIGYADWGEVRDDGDLEIFTPPADERLFEICQNVFGENSAYKALTFWNVPDGLEMNDQWWNEFLENAVNTWPLRPDEPLPDSPDIPGEPAGDAPSWKQVYHDFILGKQYMASRDSSDPEIFSDPFGNTYDINPYKDVAFGLYDWNMDGIPELFADNGALDSGWSEALVYTCSDGQLVSLGCLSNRAGGPWVTVDPGYPGVLSMSGNMGFFTMEYTLPQGPESMAGEMVFSEDYNDPETGEPLEFPVITVLSSDTGLFSAIRDRGVIPVCQFEAGSLDESSWVDFLSVSVDTARLAMDPVSVIPDQAEIVSDQPRQETEPGSPSEPVSTDSSHFSSAAPVLRESWDGRNMEEGNPGAFRSLLLDSMSYPGTWKETYLKILKENERAIRYHLTYYDEYSLDYGCSPGIIFRDITRDGIPEMFFIKAIPTELSGYTPDQYEGDLYVYSNNGTQTQCVISIPRFYCTDWIGSSYSVFFPIFNPDRLYIQFQDPLPWQVEYNVDNRFSVESTYRFTSTDYDDDNIVHFYINGAETGESEAKSYWIEPDTADYTVITSTECTPMLSGLDFDAAVRLLADPGTDAGNVEIGYPRSGRTNRANVNVRLETNKSSQLIEQIRASDTEVAVLSVRYDSKGVLWVYVQTANGNKGYVRSDMIRIMD